MAFGLVGLTPVTTKDLQALLRELHRGELRFPLDIPELTRVGLQHCALDLLHQLRGLDAEASRAVITAVLSERAKARGGRL